MIGSAPSTFQRIAKPALVAGAILIAYSAVFIKLGRDWWTDENYSHGLLIPFVIAFIIFQERAKLCELASNGSVWLGSSIISLALVLLAAGTLGAELFTQRIALITMLAGVCVYFFGKRILPVLAVPFALLLLAIPIPQILLNKIAIPLQIWASQISVWGIRIFDVPVVRNGNVLDILPQGSTQIISLEVAEACSGIRSLSTLITLALILAYLTRRNGGERSGIANFNVPDFCRAGLLMIAAIPVAVLTNAARVTGTGVLTYFYGKSASEGIFHETAGWLVYVVALGILILVNQILRAVFNRIKVVDGAPAAQKNYPGSDSPILPLVVFTIACGIGLIWFASSGEVIVPRAGLSGLPRKLGSWDQRGGDFSFGKDIESVLGATDYTMREYTLPDGRIANLYVGYYASQRTGSTYHSPQNCLPGAGWVLGEPKVVDIATGDGRVFQANLYFIENGIYREAMIYWYQGRGRTSSSEYRDRINTVIDSVTRRRTDGALVRVMTSVGDDPTAATKAAVDLAAALEEQITPFVPD